MRRSKISEISKEELQKLFDTLPSYRQIMLTMGYSNTAGHSGVLLQERAKKEIDLTIFNSGVHRKSILEMKKMDFNEMFKENSKVHYGVVKRRVLRDKLIPYCCTVCSNPGFWNGKKLSLQLDHINGNNTDHRLENLRFLCANCHSQTENFAGRNKLENKSSIGVTVAHLSHKEME